MSKLQLERYATAYTLVLSLAIVALDSVLGPLSILFALPVILLAWYRGRPLGFCLAVFIPTARLGFPWYWDTLTSWTMLDSTVNTLVRIIVLGTIAYLTDAVAQEHRALQQQVRVLRGILPICSFCKKIRDQHEHWQVLEEYITDHSEAEFTHGICPSCVKQHYSEYLGTGGSLDTSSGPQSVRKLSASD